MIRFKYWSLFFGKKIKRKEKYWSLLSCVHTLQTKETKESPPLCYWPKKISSFSWLPFFLLSFIFWELRFLLVLWRCCFKLTYWVFLNPGLLQFRVLPFGSLAPLVSCNQKSKYNYDSGLNSKGTVFSTWAWQRFPQTASFCSFMASTVQHLFKPNRLNRQFKLSFPSSLSLFLPKIPTQLISEFRHCKRTTQPLLAAISTQIGLIFVNTCHQWVVFLPSLHLKYHAACSVPFPFLVVLCFHNHCI